MRSYFVEIGIEGELLPSLSSFLFSSSSSSLHSLFSWPLPLFGWRCCSSAVVHRRVSAACITHAACHVSILIATAFFSCPLSLSFFFSPCFSFSSLSHQRRWDERMEKIHSDGFAVATVTANVSAEQAIKKSRRRRKRKRTDALIQDESDRPVWERRPV